MSQCLPDDGLAGFPFERTSSPPPRGSGPRREARPGPGPWAEGGSEHLSNKPGLFRSEVHGKKPGQQYVSLSSFQNGQIQKTADFRLILSLFFCRLAQPHTTFLTCFPELRTSQCTWSLTDHRPSARCPALRPGTRLSSRQETAGSRTRRGRRVGPGPSPGSGL